MKALAVLLFMLRLLPAAGDADVAFRLELAAAIVDATEDEQEQRQLAKIARFESNYRRDVAECKILGRAGERGAWQILARSGEERARLCVSLVDDARIALERIRESVRACWRLPAAERLAVYARGRCDSREGRRLSRVRFAP